MPAGRPRSTPKPFSPLAFFRERTGMSQGALAELVGCSLSTVQQWEANPQRLISRVYWDALVEALRPAGCGSIWDLMAPGGVADDPKLQEIILNWRTQADASKDALLTTSRAMTPPAPPKAPRRRA